MISNENLFATLTKAATLFANAMFTYTRTGYPSTKQDHNRMIYSIQDATEIGQPTPTTNGIYIDIKVNSKKAPYAYAYEFGHEGDYPIPKSGEAKMAFPKEDWPGYAPPPPAPDIFVFMKVTHHGIKAKPFMQPTINQTRQQIAELIAKEFVGAYKRSVVRVEIIK